MNIAGETELILRRVENALPLYAYRFSSEVQLQDGIARVLEQEGVSFEREHIASKADRFDFLCDGGIVIEVKTDGTFSEAIRQVQRYAALEVTRAVVIVTTKLWGHSLKDGTELSGKPVRFIRLRRQGL